MIKVSTGYREAVAITGSIRAALNNGLVRIYSGPVPASADAALGSAVLMNEISAGGTGTPGTLEPTAPGGVISKSAAENWTGNNLVGGTPSFFRYVLAGDAGDASATAVRLQGTAGGIGNDMVITALPLVAGAPQAFDLFQLVVPEQ
jgi:hypothetical protein